MQIIDLSGIWQCEIEGMTAPITIPGTLDESRIGYKDVGGKKWHPDNDTNAALYQTEDGIRTRLTRVVTHEGPARISRRLEWDVPVGMRLFLDVERSRHLTLTVNGQTVPAMGECSISTPYTFEATGLMNGRDEIVFTADNSYPGWPHDAIVFSSAATDETQTNWNGLLGYVRLRMEAAIFIQAVRVYPAGNALNVCVEINAAKPGTAAVSVSSEALRAPVSLTKELHGGMNEIWLKDLPLSESVRRWDEEEGNLYDLTATLDGQPYTVRFGVRDFRAENGYLTLNGRRIFLRSEANCAVFPETGHPPMTVQEWKQVLETYRSYGVNCMRFHSHTPPEAAFAAADEMGMLMQPELGHWNPETAFESEESIVYYTGELRGTLRNLANHPSFVMLTLGNELAAHDLGHQRMEELLALAHSLDSTRLFACGSNVHYGWYGYQDSSDFYTADSLRGHWLRAICSEMRGYLNHDYPDAKHDYEAVMSEIREECGKPVFSFEVGQFEVLPDFDELDDFKGVTRAINYDLIYQKVAKEGLLGTWTQQVEATGELSNLCYREEVEAALRTERFSGISLLSLQDFPGQGTALVGMLNAHLQPKPYLFAQPERFRAFFRAALPLVFLEKYTYETTETLTACVKVANYGKAPVSGMPEWSLEGEAFGVFGRLPEVAAPAGGLTALGTIAVPLGGISCASRLTLTVRIGGAVNRYPVWVYPPEKAVCPENVHECRCLDDQATDVLMRGGTVYLSPDCTEESLPRSIRTFFSTDFWSVGTFPKQEGGMGQLIDAAHPVFASFPTETHTNWQWWAMATRRAMILPHRMKTIVAEMDSYAYLRPMAKLLECRCLNGRLMISSMGLHQLQQHPEARALQAGIYRWLSCAEGLPDQELTVAEVRELVK